MRERPTFINSTKVEPLIPTTTIILEDEKKPNNRELRNIESEFPVKALMQDVFSLDTLIKNGFSMSGAKDVREHVYRFTHGNSRGGGENKINNYFEERPLFLFTEKLTSENHPYSYRKIQGPLAAQLLKYLKDIKLL